MKYDFKRYGTLIAGGCILVIFSLLRPETFFTVNNFINISRQMSLLVIIGLGATLIMTVDEFDLSIGAMASFAGILAAKLAVQGVPFSLAILIVATACFSIGWFNGFLVTRFNILSFITTLAMGTVLGGITFKLSGGATIFQGIPKAFTSLGTKSFSILSFGASQFRIPLLSLLMLAFTVLLWFVMGHTIFGRRLYAVGGNPVAATLSGLPVARDKRLAFALSALLAGCTGILLASRLGSATPTGGDSYFLKAYATVFLGRTLNQEGVPDVWGTFVGAAIFGILANGLTILQMPSYIQDILTGAIIIVAVIAQKQLGERRQ